MKIAPALICFLTAPLLMGDDASKAKTIHINQNVSVDLCLIKARVDDVDWEFYISDTEITNRQFSAYLEMTGYDPKESLRNLDDHPAANLAIADCLNFCKWLENNQGNVRGIVRLPTKNEWLIAAYGNHRKFPWGNTDVVDAYNYNFKYTERLKKFNTAYSGVDTNPVKAYPNGKTPEGLYGIWGNVSEYVLLDLKNEASDIVPYWMGGDYEYDMNAPQQAYWGFAHDSKFKGSNIGFRIVFLPDAKSTDLPK